MFLNYLKITFRNIKRNKLYSFINVLGLAVGFACAILILLWIQDELSYDKYHHNAKHIYRIITKDLRDNEIQGDSPFKLAPELKHLYPEVQNYVRTSNYWDATFKYGNKVFKENRIIYTDPSIFKVFSWKLGKGNPSTALIKPNSVVITRETAVKYFGNENPIGKILVKDNKQDLIVTGIMENIPDNSHFKFDFLLPINEMRNMWGSYIDSWSCVEFGSYLLFDRDIDLSEWQSRLTDFEKKYINRNIKQFSLQVLTDIHLYSSQIKWSYEQQGNIEYVYIFSAVALLIMLIASLNYMNLSTAKSIVRAKEVGIRRTLGGSRKQLIFQFLGESLILSFIGLVLAYLLAEVTLSLFNSIVDKNLDIPYGNMVFHATIILITFCVGVVSGSYPALFLSNLSVVKSIKGQRLFVSDKFSFRRISVIVQFGISIILLIGTIVIYYQLRYTQSKNLGFKKEQLISIDLNNSDPISSYKCFKTNIINSSKVESVSAATSLPPNKYLYTSVYPAGLKGEDRWNWTMKSFFVDYNFISMMGLDIIEGRDFSEDFSTDKKDAIIINEAAVRSLGWKSALGKKLVNNIDNSTASVIGVVRDFHFKSFKEPIEPVFIKPYYNWLGRVIVRITPNDMPGTIKYLEKEWNKLNPEYPFSYSFVDDSFNKLYNAEQRLSNVITTFCIIALIIASMGVFALSLFSIERRTKEIGIRKVLGASVNSVVRLLSKEFIALVSIANIMAIPAGYYIMNKWLQDFAYRIDVSWWMLLISVGIVLLIALATISFQAIKAATANPVESLKYE